RKYHYARCVVCGFLYFINSIHNLFCGGVQNGWVSNFFFNGLCQTHQNRPQYVCRYRLIAIGNYKGFYFCNCVVYCTHIVISKSSEKSSLKLPKFTSGILTNKLLKSSFAVLPIGTYINGGSSSIPLSGEIKLITEPPELPCKSKS